MSGHDRQRGAQTAKFRQAEAAEAAGAPPAFHIPEGVRDYYLGPAAAPIQRKTDGGLGSTGGGPQAGAGSALPDEARGKMEGAFGQSFADVRVHEGPQAAAMGAQAYTHGADIHFAPGRYAPSSRSGQELLGHELAHVVQQRAGRVTAPQGKQAAVNADSALEAEADVAGDLAARGERAHIAGAGERASGPGMLQLKLDGSAAVELYEYFRVHYSHGLGFDVWAPFHQELVLEHDSLAEAKRELDRRMLQRGIQKQGGAPLGWEPLFVHGDERSDEGLSDRGGLSDQKQDKSLIKEQKTEKVVQSPQIVEEILALLGLTGDVKQSIFAKHVDPHKFKDNWKHVVQQYDHYCSEMRNTLVGLEKGQFGIRWRTLTKEQKLRVAARAALAMMALGEIMINLDDEYDPEKDKVGEAYISPENGDIAMVHGSFLWGEEGHKPGDLDLMVLSGNWKPEHEYDPEPSFGTQQPPRGLTGEVSIGTKFCGPMDHLLNIPLFGERPDITQDDAKTAWEKVSGELWKLINTANSELEGKKTGNGGKDVHSAARRKVVNCAVILNHFSVQVLGKPNGTMEKIIATANEKLLAGELKIESYFSVLSDLYWEINAALSKRQSLKKTPKVQLSQKMLELLKKHDAQPNVNQFMSEVSQLGITKELALLDDEAKSFVQENYPTFAKKYWM